MPRRIDVELTSARGDGTWTWRAAGALKPKGVVEEKLLYDGARVGDVVRAEAEFGIDGIVITSVVPPKAKRVEADRLQLTGPERDFVPVTTSLVPKRDRPPSERHDRGPRREGADRGARSPERGGRPARQDPAGRTRDPAGPGARAGRPPRTDAGSPAGRPQQGGPQGRDRGGRQERGERGPRVDRVQSGGGAGRTPPAAKPRPKRLNPGNTHRAAALDSLSPEQRVIAEQLVRGGIPAVRRAVEDQNARSRQEGQPEIKLDQLLAIAEELLPRMRTAEWRDRAEAAAADVEEIALRDLRSVVAGADAAARDDDTRILASTLRQALERRLAAQRDDWVSEMTASLDDGRLVRALRLSSRPPDPSIRCPSELAVRLSEAASTAMAPDAPPERWAALLEAVGASPVRRTVKPVGLPADPGEPLLHAAQQAAGRVPALAALLGIDMPPPPGPARPPRPGARPVPPRPRPAGRPARPPGRAPGTTPAAAPAAYAGDRVAAVTNDAADPPAAQSPPDPVATSAADAAAGTAPDPVTNGAADPPAALAAGTAPDAVAAEATAQEPPVDTGEPTEPPEATPAVEDPAGAPAPAGEGTGDPPAHTSPVGHDDAPAPEAATEDQSRHPVGDHP